MAKATPLPCTPVNCGELFARCGTTSTYAHQKCRCESCCDAKRKYDRQLRLKRNVTSVPRGACSVEHCGSNFPTCGKPGTFGSYRKCRCDVCATAKRAASAALKKKHAVGPGLCSSEHCGQNYPSCGSTYTYTHRKCRCDACVAAKCIDRASRLASVSGVPSGQCSPAHCGDAFSKCGTNSAYSYWKCRCDACKDAHASAAKKAFAENPVPRLVAGQRRRARIAGVLNIDYTDEQLAAKYAYWGDACYLNGPDCSGLAEAIEHVIPVEKYGPNVLANIRPACKSCNSAKWAHWPYPIPYYPGRSA